MNTDNKIIFIDMDGTLISYDKVLPESAKKAISLTKEKGNKVVLCTGRSKIQLIPEIFALNFDGYILGNGAYVEFDNKVILHRPIKEEDCNKITDYFKANNIAYYFETNEGLFISEHFEEQGNQAFQKYAKFWGRKDYDHATIYNSLIGIKDNYDPKYKVNRISYALNTYKDYTNVSYKFANFNNGVWGGVSIDPIFGFICEKGISKGEGVKQILDYSKIPFENTISFGDSHIDITMFKNTFDSVCMKNGSFDAKKEAKYITDSLENDGIYKGFEKLNLI